MVAPMLLCHIYSSWRAVALASPTLWSHLTYCVTILPKDSSDLLVNELEFIRWWRKNHGSIAPFLSFSVPDRHPYDSDEELEKDGMSFLLDYITSAQYLNLDNVFWNHLQDRSEAGNKFVFPYLHTLEKDGWEPARQVDAFYCVQTKLIPPHAPSNSMLRHLSIMYDVLETSTLDHIPIHWSKLTHIYLHNNITALDVWYTLIRGLPNLQWGYFRIRDFYSAKDDTEPTKYIHPQLSTLYLAFNDYKSEVPPGFELSLLFSNLHLPAVRTFSLSWWMTNTGWYDFDIISELYTILESTPAVTTLVLGEHFIPLDDATITHREPIWAHLTHLTDLRLELPLSRVGRRSTAKLEKVLDNLGQNAFFSEGSWADLRNPACPIRSVTIVDNTPSSYDEAAASFDDDEWDYNEPDDEFDDDELDEEFDDESDGGFDDGSDDSIGVSTTSSIQKPTEKAPGVAFKRSIGDFTMSSIRKHAEKAPDVVFQLLPESAREVATDAWNEWGLKLLSCKSSSVS